MIFSLMRSTRISAYAKPSKQAEAEHKTIFEFAPKSKGADDMSALTDEIIAKLLQ